MIIEETGYNRNISFGEPTGIGLFPIFNPIDLFFKLVPAVFVGINNFLANFGLATEIPLSPTTPIPSPPVTGEQEEDLDQAKLMANDQDKLSRSKLSLVQDIIDGKQKQTDGDEKTAVVYTKTEEDPTLIEGNEMPLVEGAGTPVVEGTTKPEVEGSGPPVVEETTKSEKSKETVLGLFPTGNVEEAKQNGKEAIKGDGNAVVVGKKPKDKKKANKSPDPVQSRVDADNRSASLNFSPNEPAEGTTKKGDGARQPDSTANPQPAEGPENAKASADSKDSEPAAA